MERAIGIFYGDAVNGEVDRECVADGKVLAKRSFSNAADLVVRKAFREAFCRIARFGDEAIIDSCFRADGKAWFLEVEAVVIACLDDNFLPLGAFKPSTEDIIFNLERAEEGFAIKGYIALG